MAKFTQAHLEQLNVGLVELGINLSEDSTRKLIQYLELLSKWNKSYNLTAITDPEAMVISHLLDSLSIQKYIKGSSIIDVGTGAGLPGIPLAIANPEKIFTLLDSLGKRTTFLQQVKYELKLYNVNVVDSRAEDYRPDIGYDQVITRAFSSLGSMLQATKHLGADTTQFLAMKGANYTEELEEIPDTYTIVSIYSLSVPGLDAKRHLIILEGSHSG